MSQEPNLYFEFRRDLESLRLVVNNYGKKRIASNLKLTRFVAQVNKLDNEQRQAFYMASCGHRKVNQWHLDMVQATLKALQ